MPEPEHIADLRAAVRAADDEVYRTLQANDFAMTTGAYDAACRALASARQALADAEAKVPA